MNKIHQHIPNFYSGFTPQSETFADTKELLAIPWVRYFSDIKSDEKFYRFSLDREEKRLALMAEYAGGTSWRVVGFIEVPCNHLDLPNWSPQRPGLLI